MPRLLSTVRCASAMSLEAPRLIVSQKFSEVDAPAWVCDGSQLPQVAFVFAARVWTTSMASLRSSSTGLLRAKTCLARAKTFLSASMSLVSRCAMAKL